MGCPDGVLQEIGSGEFARRLRAAERSGLQVPFSASLDLTRTCNLRCVHCYIRPHGTPPPELSTAQAQTVLDRLAQGGVLFLVITGGEPLLRPDFPILYRHAKGLGIIPTLFTNATLIDDAALELLASDPPRRVEITIYGHTAATYEAVTGVAGSHRRFRAGVERLLERGLLVRLKAMLLRRNVHEFAAMKEWAHTLGCEFRYDALVHPRLGGDPAPLSERLPPDEIAALHLSDPADREELERYLERLGDDIPPRTRLFECGAGSMTLHVDSVGDTHPCMLWRSDPYSLLTHKLDAEWLAHVARLLARPTPEGECVACRDRGLCTCCAPTAQLEAGGPATPPRFYCQLAAARRERLLRQ